MSTFKQWNTRKPLKRITWLCGPEWVLVHQVYSAYMRLGPPTTVLYAGVMPEYQVWDKLLAAPPAGGRVVIVYGAEKLQSLENMTLLAEADELDTAMAVFVSQEKDFTRVQNEEGKNVLAQHLAVLQSCKAAQIIRCSAPSNEEDRIALVAEWWPGAGKNLAASVLSLCGGSLLYAWQACDKARRAGLDPDTTQPEHVTLWVPGKEYADHLVAGSKKDAMASAPHLTDQDMAAALGLLASRLTMLAQINLLKGRGLSASEVAMKLKADRFLYRLLAPHAAAYTPARVRRCRELLAIAESAWRSGARTGVAEAIAALW